MKKVKQNEHNFFIYIIENIIIFIAMMLSVFGIFGTVLFIKDILIPQEKIEEKEFPDFIHQETIIREKNE